MTETKRYSTKETAQFIREALKAAFPGFRFSVTTKYGGCGYAATTVSWTDGPTEPEVERVTDRFTSKGFDGMTDSTTYHEQTFNGERVKFSGWVNVERRTSDELKARAYHRACLEFGVEPRDDGQFWNDYRQTGGTDTIGTITSRILHRMRPNGCVVTLKDAR